MKDTTLEELAGGEIPPMFTPAAEPTPKAVGAGFGKRANTGAGPGTVPRPANVGKAPQRELGGFRTPSENELRHLQRVDKVRTAVNDTVKRTDANVVTILALIKELRGADGGTEVAERHSLDLATAEALATDLKAVLDKHLPPSS